MRYRSSAQSHFYQISLQHWINAKSNSLYKKDSNYRNVVDMTIPYIEELIIQDKIYDV